jgi:hypothetical protein
MTDRLITDVGGLPAGEVPREDRPPVFWQRQMIATFNLLRDEKRRIANLDEIRRTVEEFTADDYNRLGFYERRLEGIINLLEEKGILTRQEVEARADKIMSEGTRDHVA